jgi:4-hydroxybenzoate polyprenyltransferase
MRRLVNLYLAIRLWAVNFTVLLPLVGAASAQNELPLRVAATLFCIAIPFHVFAYVLNDVADLWVDKSEPLRADSPLVQGFLSRRQALWLALLQPPLAFALALLAGATPGALVMLAVAFAAMAGYDLYGKRCAWPLLTDGLQALGWCALLLTGALWHGPLGSPALVWLTAYVFTYALLANGFHGALRDLANDFACGARTTAIWLGARPGAGDAVSIPRQLLAYGLVLQVAQVACVLGVLRSMPEMARNPWRAVPVALCLAALALLPLTATRFLRSRRSLIIFCLAGVLLGMAAMPMLYVPVMNPEGAMAMGAAFALPVLAMYLHNGRHWRA